MLKKLAKRINWEIRQAEDYCTQAMLVKHHSPSTAELFVTLSNEEAVHAEKLLREGQKLIDEKALKTFDKELKAEHEEAHYEKCKHIWEWEYRIAMERIAEVRYNLNTYRSM